MTEPGSASPVRVVVLGAGFGGLELSTVVHEACGDAAQVTLIDKADGFVFGFSKLDVMFGKDTADHVTHLYRDAVMPGVSFVHAEITAIDPVNLVVQTTAGEVVADVLVVALGCGVDPSATPGLVEGGHEFYTNSGAFALRETLADFHGGRVVVGVTSTPFKCPPAPSEAAMLMHEFLTGRGLRERSEIALVMPFGRPVPPSPEASAAILARFEEFGIEWHPNSVVTGLDPERGMVLRSGHDDMPYDLFLAVPRHSAPDVVVAAGLTVDGWIPVDPHTMATSFRDVYAVGDVTSVGTPKAGVFAEGQARIAAEHVIARVQGRSSDARYDGVGRCYLEFGDGAVAQVDVTFAAGEAPHGTLFGPDESLQRDKSAFGSDRVQRWFGRDWRPGAPAKA
jgi:sulfide:quinone oxidoreductase